MNTNIWGDLQICSSVPLKEMWKSKWFAGMAERAKLQWQIGKKTNPYGKKIFEGGSFKRIRMKVGFFNITYQTAFSELKTIHLLLTLDGEHGKFFEKIPVIGYRRTKILKGILGRPKVAPLE